MKKKQVIGITGGIGSGKSYVLTLIAQRGYPTYQADVEAKKLMESDPAIRQSLIDLIGEEVYTESGGLNRAYLAQRLFADPILKSQVEHIIHPRTIAHFTAWAATQKAEYIFKEAALTLEVQAYQGIDKLVVVYAPIALRVARIKQSKGLSDTEIRMRLAAQWPDIRKLRYADWVLYNFPSAPPLEEQLDNFFFFLHDV
ncbi:MAG: dephospho-CoA kinase [Bacteroidia bacterium]